MSELKKFLVINKVEGISFIVLLFIAMPLKYYFNYPLATRVIGSIHGVLFIIFIWQLYKAQGRIKFNFKEAGLYFILSLVPFGSFYTDRYIKNRYFKPVKA